MLALSHICFRIKSCQRLGASPVISHEADLYPALFILRLRGLSSMRDCTNSKIVASPNYLSFLAIYTDDMFVVNRAHSIPPFPLCIIPASFQEYI
jgi:hypothetical protein